MLPGIAVLGAMVLLVAEPPAHAATVADVVTLRDGSVVLGQIAEMPPRGPLSLVVRRAWIEAKYPRVAARWEAAEAPALHRARQLRRDRLNAWKRDRAGHVEAGDRILAALDRMLDGLKDDAEARPSALMMVKLDRGEVKELVRRPKATARLLRLGWLSGFANVETLTLDELKNALEGRGFAVAGSDPAALDRLLPLQAETEAHWLNRRAATEVLNDSGLKFLETNGVVLPEPAPGQPIEAAGALSILGDLKGLLGGEAAADPMANRLGDVAARGRSGAVVTKLEISPDLAAVKVASTLWVRGTGGRWSAAGMRDLTVRPDDLAKDAGANLAQDPQVQTAFSVVESLGLGKIPAEVKQRSLNMGAATQKALAGVRAAMLGELEALAVPLDAP